MFGIWLLSTRKTLDWKNKPVTIMDFKGDELIAEIEELGGAREIDITEKPPKKPGLYVIRPDPIMTPADMRVVDEYLLNLWRNEDHGLFIDEGYELAKSKGFVRILTQGRSKNIPCIMLLQRPVWAPRFCFTEAQYYALLNLTDERDTKTVQSFVNTDIGQHRLPYHALWYDVGANAGRGEAVIFKPVPDTHEIAEAFRPQKRGLAKRVL